MIDVLLPVVEHLGAARALEGSDRLLALSRLIEFLLVFTHVVKVVCLTGRSVVVQTVVHVAATGVLSDLEPVMLQGQLLVIVKRILFNECRLAVDRDRCVHTSLFVPNEDRTLRSKAIINRMTVKVGQSAPLPSNLLRVILENSCETSEGNVSRYLPIRPSTVNRNIADRNRPGVIWWNVSMTT